MARNTRTLDMDGLAKALEDGSKDLTRNLRKDVRKAGEVVRTSAQVLAAEHSTKIASAIKLSVIQGSRVRITAYGPLAKMYEVGNQGGGKVVPTFNHPVYARGPRGSWTWVPKEKRQHRYPFLLPAWTLRRGQVLILMNAAIADSWPGNG